MNYYKIALECALTAGNIIKDNYSKSANVNSKGDFDVVTQTDIDSEQSIIERIRHYLPEHGIISEEAGKLLYSSEFIWIIDPLDGTGNFITGNSYFSVSIAMAYKREVLLGIVYNPITNELYSAEKGKGAWLHDQKLKVSSRDKLSECYLATAFAANEHDIANGIKVMQNISTKCRRMVINFAPALDLCNIARGKVDALIDNGSTCEDHAAGSLILKEAGGIVENLHSLGWDPFQTGILASNGLIQSNLRDWVKR